MAAAAAEPEHIASCDSEKVVVSFNHDTNVACALIVADVCLAADNAEITVAKGLLGVYIKGNYNVVRGSLFTITGHHNKIMGSCVGSSGNDTEVMGTRCTVRGNRCKYSGNNGIVNGDHCKIQGNFNTIHGVDPTVVGINNNINGVGPVAEEHYRWVKTIGNMSHMALI